MRTNNQGLIRFGNSFPQLDIIRAIAIILVVVGHFTPENAPKWYNMIVEAIYTFHMPAFLFVSGYVYIATKKEESYLSFLYKKVRRLLIPYFSTSAIVITIKLLTQSFMYVENPITANAYIEMFYIPVAGYFLWFVLALWWMFVLLPWFKTRSMRLILFGISIVLLFLPIEFTHIFCLQEIKKMLVYFMCGIVSFDYKEKFTYMISKYSKSVLIPIVFLILEIVYLLGMADYLQYVLPFIGIAFISQISNTIYHIGHAKLLSIMLYLNTTSYIIYLFHTTFEGFGKSFLHKFHLVQSSNEIMFCISSLLVILWGIMGPVCLYSLFKRFNVTKLLFGLK